MKLKTLLISILTGATVAGGGVLAARQAAVSSRKPVQVMPVVNADLALQYASWGFDSEDSMYGSIISKDTQKVNLTIGDGQTLKSVYVSEGDTVKTGDILLEYDVRKKELEREAHDLALQLSKLQLSGLERELEEIRKKNPALFVGLEEEPKTASADTGLPDAILEAEEETESLEGETEEIWAALAADDLLDGPEAEDDEKEGLTDGFLPEGDSASGKDSLEEGAFAGAEEDLIEDGSLPEEADLLEADLLEPDLLEEDLPDEGMVSDETLFPEEEETGMPEEVVSDAEQLAEEAESVLDQKIREATEFATADPEGNVNTEGSNAVEMRTTDLSEDGQKMQDHLRMFLRIVNLLTRQYTTDPASVSEEDLEQARILYERALAKEVPIRSFLDGFGEVRSVSLFVPGTDTLRALKEMEEAYSDFSAADTLKALHQAYANYLCYRLRFQMHALEEALNTEPEQVSAELARTYEQQIRQAADTWYQLYFFWRYLRESVPKLALSSSLYEPLPELYLEELRKTLLLYAVSGSDKVREGMLERSPLLGRGYTGELSLLVCLLADDALIETESLETETEDMTDWDDWYDDDGGEEGDDAETPEELRESFYEKLMAIRNQRVSVRQAQLELKKDDQEIEKATVRASMDGVVRSAGTVEEGTGSTDNFIVVAGEMGMYAVGSVSEMERDTISIGDTVTGSSEETGQDFTATITEILDYPVSGENDDYYFYSSSSDITNSNASQYQFYAYIEDSKGLEEGYATLSLGEKAASEDGIMLEDYLVREEEFGDYYVYIRGEDGRLKKQVVTVGKKQLWGSGKNILEGLDYEDMIAFPADSVREGDPTTEVDFLEDIYYG